MERVLPITSSSIENTIQPGNLTDQQIVTLSFIYLSTGILSLFGSLSIVVVTIAKGKVFNQEIHPIFHLSLADFFGSAFLIAGDLMYHALKHGTVKSKACPYLTAFATAFYMSTFLLTLNYARSINENVQKRTAGGYSRQPTTHFMRIGVNSCSAMLLWYGFAWFLPFMLTFCLFAIDQASYGPYDHICSSCLPLFHYKNSDCQEKNIPDNKSVGNWYGVYKYSFLFVLAVSFIGALAFNWTAYRKFRMLHYSGGVMSQRQRKYLKLVKRRLSLFSFAFLFCWIPSVVLGIVSLFPSFEMKTMYWLFILQACTCPLQGFINSLIYGWYRPGFKQVINERTHLLDPGPPSPVESDV